MGNYCKEEITALLNSGMQLPARPGAAMWGWGPALLHSLGWGTCSHIFWGGADIVFPSQSGLGVADRPFLPFSVGPLQRVGCLFFFLFLRALLLFSSLSFI